MSEPSERDWEWARSWFDDPTQRQTLAEDFAIYRTQAHAAGVAEERARGCHCARINEELRARIRQLETEVGRIQDAADCIAYGEV